MDTSPNPFAVPQLEAKARAYRDAAAVLIAEAETLEWEAAQERRADMEAHQDAREFRRMAARHGINEFAERGTG